MISRIWINVDLHDDTHCDDTDDDDCDDTDYGDLYRWWYMQMMMIQMMINMMYGRYDDLRCIWLVQSNIDVH